MLNTIAQYMAGTREPTTREALRAILNPIGDRLSSQTLTSAALRIKGGSASAIVQTNAASVFLVKGVLVTKATSTDMTALAGTVTSLKVNVFVHFIDAAGTVTVAMGVEGATLAAAKFPPIPENKAVVGFTIIGPTGTGNFVGGTTALDDVTVVPAAVFVNTLGAFDPSILLT